MPRMPPTTLKLTNYQRNQQKIGKTLIVAILTKNASFRSYGTFAYLLCAYIRNINMRQLVHVDMN